jgi:predicted nucleotidyltransferase
MPTTAADTRRLVQAREDARRAEARALAARLEAWLPVAREVLSRHGASRAWVFGSMVDGGVHADSDVDLAVEGMTGIAQLQAHAELSRDAPCSIDLVRIEDAPAALREAILRRGRELP